jgi:pimeloyl-ACP methyl ester carboxylesterase
VTGRLQTRSGALEYVVSGAGRPAIVLFNGAGMTLDGWRALHPRMESLGTVVEWNRFGIEGSDSPGRIQSGAVVIASVRELLHYAGIDPPWLLVGHSVGALYADLFARMHPDEVGAVLKVAPADLERVPRMNEDSIARSLGKVQQLPARAFRQNLHAELVAVARIAQEIEGAGAFPHDVPVAIVESARGHFPQLTEPDAVLDALERLVRRSRRSASASRGQPA